MNPAGVIITYMGRKDWKGKKLHLKIGIIFFNLCLFVFQLVFMVVGTICGKIKETCDEPNWTLGGFIISLNIAALTALIVQGAYWWYWPVCFIGIIIGLCEGRGIDWCRVWRAAQASHVRLCLQRIDPKWVGMELKKFKYHYEDTMVLKFSEVTWQYINFGYPKAEMQYWRPDQCDGKRFEYREPTFDPSPEFIAAMIEYAEAQVGKRYDHLQLLSYGLNFIVWLFCWPKWGREVFRWLNLRGGREVCSSGLVACLRWAYLIRYGFSAASAKKVMTESNEGYRSLFFKGYDTATTSPCLVPLSKNWKKVAQ